MKNLFKQIKKALWYLALILVSTFAWHAVSAQVKVGENPSSINAGSVLEIESGDKGLLLPRLPLSSTTSWGLAGSPVAGMQVFNNSTSITAGSTSYPIASGGVGVYYWDGVGWVPSKNIVTSGSSDFDWLRSVDNGSQNVIVRTNDVGPDIVAKLTVRSGYQVPVSPRIASLFAGSDPNGDGFVGIQSESFDPFVFRTFGGDERMRISLSGSVGIGTKYPASFDKLSVNGSFVQSNNYVASNATERVRLENGGVHILGASGAEINGNITFKDNEFDDFDARIHYSSQIGDKGALILGVTSTGKGTDPGYKSAVTILNENGHVGINELSPFYQLSVGGDINASGEVRNSGNVITSDWRLKRNIVQFQNALAVIAKLNPVRYSKKATIADSSYNRSEIGFIAQEVQKIPPQLVREGKDADKILALDYNSLIPILTKAIQEQQKQIETLSAERDAQKAQLNEQSVGMMAQSVILTETVARLDTQASELKEIKRLLRMNSVNTAALYK